MKMIWKIKSDKNINCVTLLNINLFCVSEVYTRCWNVRDPQANRRFFLWLFWFSRCCCWWLWYLFVSAPLVTTRGNKMLLADITSSNPLSFLCLHFLSVRFQFLFLYFLIFSVPYVFFTYAVGLGAKYDGRPNSVQH